MEERKLVTVRHSRERIELLAKASTHGAKFCATHGEHLTLDDMFKACEVRVMESEVKRMVPSFCYGRRMRKKLNNL